MSRLAKPSPGVLVATGAMAVHVVDDNLVEPGLGAVGDHLVAMLVPLAVLAALVWAPPPRRAGARAVVTLVLGVLGLMFASEAIYHLGSDGLARDDWTGLLSGVAGLYLIGVGARDLWRSRRTDDPRWRRYGRRALKTAAALFLIVQFGYPVVESYALANTGRRDVPEAHLGAPYEDVSFRTTDGHLLRGWYVPSRNRAAVIVYPGRGGPQRHARMLIERGYGVLLFDPRGSGHSGGEPTAFGWGNEHDIHGAVDFLQRRPDVDDERIGGLGLSVGGEVLLHAAAEDDGLQAVVSEGAGIRSWSEYREVDGPGRLLWTPVMATRMFATSVFTNRMPPPGLHDLVPRIDVPVFFIYSANSVGGEDLTEDYHALATGPKQLWRTDGAHIGGIDDDRDVYQRRVVGFLDEALLQR